MATISGKTRLAGLFGADTSHSLSPQIHNFFAKKLGVDMVYTCFNVQQANLASAVKGAYNMGIVGLNITSPHKIAVIPHLATLDASAQNTNAVNLLKHMPQGYVGYNTDVYGVLETLRRHNVQNIKSATILGNGGAAKAAKIALEQLGCKNISLLHRKPLSNHGGSLLINATPASFDELEAIAPLHQLKNFECIFDMNYPKNNSWIKSAENFGIKAFDGKSMLVFQAVRSFEVLWNVTLPKNIVNEILLDIII